MPWQLSIVIHGFLSGSRSVFGKQVLRTSQQYILYLTFLSFSFLGMFSIIQAVVHSSEIDYSGSIQIWPVILLMAICLAVHNVLTLKILHGVSASYYALLALLSPLAIITLSSIFNNETLSMHQIVGSLFLLSSVLLLRVFGSSKSKGKKKQNNVAKVLPIVFIDAAIYGIGMVAEKSALDSVGFTTYTVVGWGSQFLAVMVIILLLRKDLIMRASAKTHVSAVLYAILLVVSGFFYVLTTLNSDSASISAIGSTFKVVATAVLAFIFLRERDSILLKLCCVVLSGFGLHFLFS